MQECNTQAAVLVAEQVPPLADFEAPDPDISAVNPGQPEAEEWSAEQKQAAETLTGIPSVMRVLHWTAHRYQSSDPEAIAQESIIKLSNMGSALDTENIKRLLGLARQIAARLTMDEHRRRDTLTKNANKAEELWQPLRQEQDVEAQVLARMRERVVGEAIGKLSDLHRPIMQLILSGQTVTEAAEDLELNPRTARTRVHRACQVMRRHLEDMGITETF